MNNSLNRIKQLNIGEYIFGIFILISILGIIANNNEKDYINNKNVNGKKNAHKLRLVILTLALLIYIYYLDTRIKNKKNKTNAFLANLDIFATILFVIGGLIFLYTEYKGDEENIIIE